jgi:hypothetical protein
MEDVFPDRTYLQWGSVWKFLVIWVAIGILGNFIIPPLIFVVFGHKGEHIIMVLFILLMFVLAFLPSLVIMYRVFRDRWYMRYKSFAIEPAKAADIIEDILARRRLRYNLLEEREKRRIDPINKYKAIFLINPSDTARLPAQLASKGIIIRIKDKGGGSTLVELGPEKGALAKTVIEIGRDIDKAMAKKVQVTVVTSPSSS